MSLWNQRALGLTIVGAAGLLGCQSPIEGEYRLDFEQTKLEVEKNAAESAEDAPRKDAVLRMLQNTELTFELAKGGKVRSTTKLTADGTQRTTSEKQGTWKRDGQRVIISEPSSPDTTCTRDGKLLRCSMENYDKLYSRYVLARK
jgi:hypothetical protein